MPFFEMAMNAVTSLHSNPYFSAGTGLIGVGAGMAALRGGAVLANRVARRNLTLSMEIPSRDKSYQWMMQWMSKNKSMKSQSFSVETSYRQHENGEIHSKTHLLPDVGEHYVNYRGRLLKVERTREKNIVDVASGGVWETLQISTIGRDKKIFLDLLEEARIEAVGREESKTVIYSNAGTEWRRLGFPRKKRPLSSVILDEGMAENLKKDVAEFLETGSWYNDRGIPYRRGYLLHGPPGCGKSSFITALAGDLGMSICILNLSSKNITDDILNALLINAPQRSIILLEDIDAAVDRKPENVSGVTFSGLLNALDGVAATEGRVMFMTTNHIERLDAALIRPGRVDVIEKIDYASKAQVAHLFMRFFPGHDTEARQFAELVPERTVSMAYLQNYLLAYRADAQVALSNAHRIMGN